ncbi:morphogenic membrane protein MmpB [Streptomyces hygroscopicus]|uniref:morphogenic membrane protein MmpB n=1 Tax=Streptomyces hygroscopicus TaxID=1912 RepID=UPI0036ADE9DD
MCFTDSRCRIPPLMARRPAENADEPPEELWRAQAMLRRARTVPAVAIVIATCLLSMRP